MNGDREHGTGGAGGAAAGERVWDLPTRLFHWLLVVLVTVSVVTGKTGDMDIHLLSGCAILGLVLFRLGWGLVGGRHARFVDFVRGPGAVADYAKALVRGRAPRWRGHNPLGGWSVMSMLVVLAVQAAMGLFANDDIFTEGPLARYVSKETSDFVTWLHYLNGNLLLALVAVHVAAVVFYLVKGDNLVRPMIGGRKPGPFDLSGELGKGTPAEGSLLVALGLALVAAGVAVVLATL